MNEKKTSAFKKNLMFLLGFIALLWVIHLVNSLMGMSLNEWGIRPRSLGGLWGLLFSPFLHGDWLHLIMNTWPLLILGGLVLFRGLDTFIELTIFVTIVGGLGVWIVGAGSSLHVGASGVIFGYFGYLVARGVLNKDIIAVVVAGFVFLSYGIPMFLGILPIRSGISWEGHLFGMLTGILAAWMEMDAKRKK